MATAKSTPIHTLPSNNDEDISENTQIINEILKELESNVYENIEAPQQYITLQQRMSPHYQQQQRVPPQEQQRISPQYQQQRISPQYEEDIKESEVNKNFEKSTESDNIFDIIEKNNENIELPDNENMQLNTLNLTEDLDLNKLLIIELKRPLIIILLSIAFSLPAFNRSLLSFIPKLANETGNMNFLGIIVKAILLGLLYYILDKCF